jgi:signal transduction histidine kinase
VTEQGTLMAELMSRLAHDLRSPLGLVSGALSELGGAGPANPKQGTLVNLAGKGLRRIERLAERMAIISSLEAHRLELEVVACDLADVVRGACERAAALEARKGIDFAIDVAPTPVRGDCDRLTMALAELVGNAWRHARKQVRVTVRGGPQPEVIVEDDGAGVAPAAKPWLFTRFDAASGRAAGNLGLSLARDLARAHGGDVTHDEQATGGRFVLRLTPGG